METENISEIEASKKVKREALLFFYLTNISAIVSGLIASYFASKSDMGGLIIIFFFPFIGILYLIFLYYSFKFILAISKNELIGTLIWIMIAIFTLIILYILTMLLGLIWIPLFRG